MSLPIGNPTQIISPRRQRILDVISRETFTESVTNLGAIPATTIEERNMMISAFLADILELTRAISTGADKDPSVFMNTAIKCVSAAGYIDARERLIKDATERLIEEVDVSDFMDEELYTLSREAGQMIFDDVWYARGTLDASSEAEISNTLLNLALCFIGFSLKN